MYRVVKLSDIYYGKEIMDLESETSNITTHIEEGDVVTIGQDLESIATFFDIEIEDIKLSI